MSRTTIAQMPLRLSVFAGTGGENLDAMQLISREAIQIHEHSDASVDRASRYGPRHVPLNFGVDSTHALNIHSVRARHPRRWGLWRRGRFRRLRTGADGEQEGEKEAHESG